MREYLRPEAQLAILLASLAFGQCGRTEACLAREKPEGMMHDLSDMGIGSCRMKQCPLQQAYQEKPSDFLLTGVKA